MVAEVEGFITLEPQPQSHPPSQASNSYIVHHWATNGQITPGTITYTTSSNADGHVINHPFRAVPASYQTSQGIVHGLQWVPADATQISLTGAQLSNTGLAAGSFDLDSLRKEDDAASQKLYEQTLQSTLPGAPDTIAMAASLFSPRGRSPQGTRAPSPVSLLQHPSHSRSPSRAPSTYQSSQQSTSPYPSYRTSSSGVDIHPHVPPPYQSRRQLGSSYPLQYTPSPYVPPPQVVYPHGYALDDQPILASQLQVPTSFPNIPSGPGFYSSSRMPIVTVHRESVSHPSLHPFARTPNTTQAYAPFSMTRIQGMDQFLSQIPSMPSVLNTHDVYDQDWSTFMNSISFAWKGTLPLPTFARGFLRSSIVADLISRWNNSFFLPRRVEIVLYKGCERRSGPHAGTVDDRVSLPASENDKYSLYLTCVTPYTVDGRLRSTSYNTHRAYGSSMAAHNPVTYAYYY
ncbi:uncharacterized protein EDB93DRAFT_1117218 [Suillus bovinus]|uniref:uncharacterized protein n=1 Tax=Suillus bovinus TaxID=48563 RepID=UPI001B87769C|nr:uncharacterized protein EDB93DRAFT_1117218 [Suillus bovinus]KAG2158951.1 hypothetical protein EDB93DRAFT_1117218 [Suillus bovinus]